MNIGTLITTAFVGVSLIAGLGFVSDSLDGNGNGGVQSALVGLNNLSDNTLPQNGMPTKVNGYSAHDMLVKGQFTRAVTGK